MKIKEFLSLFAFMPIIFTTSCTYFFKEKEKSEQIPNAPISSKPTSKPLVINKDNSAIKIAHWNVKNQNGKNNFKNIALTNIINAENFDIVGLTEIDDLLGVVSLIDILNKANFEYKWEYKISNKDYTAIKKGTQLEMNSKQREHVGIIYKSSKVKLIADTLYENIPWSNLLDLNNPSADKYSYIRPPYGAKFLDLNTNQDFTCVFAHFDSPGIAKENEDGAKKFNSDFGDMGAQEANEALKINGVMKFYDAWDGDNNELIFMGDTNIKLGKQNLVFKNIIDDKYTFYSEDNEQWKTSLKTSVFGEYSQPYDKIIYKGDAKITNPGLIKIYDSLKNKYIDQKWIDEVIASKNPPPKNPVIYPYTFISDHCPIYLTINLDKNDKN
ncbi:endonuclease/exonuclease/phosphatase family protein [Mycoplasma elephantis]|uniref:endonuclease/exonuclease/phosphatase family protein n=1 Tax=Mycoplasma elephantis TaxID=114882 RepID=UPI0012EB9C94|nr:endonuclease/exonuclease/phosphatase family protein [Mycoplasma elephantis]